MTVLITEPFGDSNLHVNVHLETTRQPVIDVYQNAIAQFDALLSHVIPPEGFAETVPFGPNEIEAIIAPGGQDPNLAEMAIFDLLALAVNGRTDKIDPNDPNSGELTFYLTTEMMQRVNQLIDSLRLAGATIDIDALDFNAIPPDLSSISIKGQELRVWLDYALLSPAVVETVQSAVSAGGHAGRTLQSMIELEYVRTGNELLADKLGDLEESLTLTKDILDTLQRLQDVHNQVEVLASKIFNFDFTLGDISGGVEANNRAEYVQNYLSAASAYFNDPLTLQFSTEQKLFMGGANSQAQQLKDELIEIEDLLRLQKINLSAATVTNPAEADPNSLRGRLSAVLDDLAPATGGVGTTNATQWLFDGMLGAGGSSLQDSGKIQQGITFAISAGQSLNDRQKEEVRRFLFVFEEYYKSASSLLQKITQIIEKIAQGIART